MTGGYRLCCAVSLRTTSDPRRNQIIRYLDLAAYHYLNHPDNVKEFYLVLIIDTERPPWILTRYRYNQNLTKGLTNPGLFKPPMDTDKLLSKGIGWLTWKQLRQILEFTRKQFWTHAERKFVEDLIVYLDHKIRDGERIQSEKIQLSFCWEIGQSYVPFLSTDKLGKILVSLKILISNRNLSEGTYSGKKPTIL